MYVGKVRTGSKTLNADIYLDAVDVFSHHILVPEKKEEEFLI